MSIGTSTGISAGRQDDHRSEKSRLRLFFSTGGIHYPLIQLMLATAIPILLLAGGIAYFVTEQEREDARRAASLTAEHVAERVASVLNTQLQVIDALGVSAALDDPDLDEFYTEAKRLLSARLLWHTVELAEPSGLQILNLLRPPNSALGKTADEESFERVVRTKQAAIGGIGPTGTISGRRLVALRVPVMRNGALRFVLSVALSPEAVGSILRQAGPPEGWTGTIIDARGNIIAEIRSRPARDRYPGQRRHAQRRHAGERRILSRSCSSRAGSRYRVPDAS